MKLLIFSALAIILSGCISTSEVVQIKENHYFITAKDKGGIFSPDGQVVGAASQKAIDYCNVQGKQIEIIEMKRDPEGPMRFETSDIYFSCK